MSGEKFKIIHISMTNLPSFLITNRTQNNIYTTDDTDNTVLKSSNTISSPEAPMGSYSLRIRRNFPFEAKKVHGTLPNYSHYNTRCAYFKLYSSYSIGKQIVCIPSFESCIWYELLYDALYECCSKWYVVWNSTFLSPAVQCACVNYSYSYFGDTMNYMHYAGLYW